MFLSENRHNCTKMFQKKEATFRKLNLFLTALRKKKRKNISKRALQDLFARFFFCFHKGNRCANSDLGENISDLIQIISDQREPSLVSNAGIMMRNRKFYNFLQFSWRRSLNHVIIFICLLSSRWLIIFKLSFTKR